MNLGWIVGTPKHPVCVNTHAVHTSPLNDITNTIDEGSVIPIVSDNTRPFERYFIRVLSPNPPKDGLGDSP